MTDDATRARFTGRALPLRGNDIDTDRIIPARFLMTVTFDGLGEHAFADDRAQLSRSGATHAFDDPRFSGSSVLLTNQNFGCGSSREHAPQALMRAGIAVVIGESFAEIFFANCQAIGVPCLSADEATLEKLMSVAEEEPTTAFEVDVDTLQVATAGVSFPLSLGDGPRRAFLEGRWDVTQELLDARAQIAATAQALPYTQNFELS